MGKINTFNVKQLRTEESFGFHKQVETETAYLPNDSEDDRPVIESLDENTPTVRNSVGSSPALTAAIDKYTTAVNTFDDALKDSGTVPGVAVATAADEVRDKAWRGSNAYLKAMTAHPDEAVRATAKEVKSLFDKYGDPTTLSQTEESGVLHNLLQDLKTLDSSKLTAIAFNPWLADMESSEETFLETVKVRTEEESTRVVGIVKQSRLAADDAYRKLVETVNALSVINGAEPYALFTDHLNVLIDRQKTVLKTRATKNTKKKDDDRPTIE